MTQDVELRVLTGIHHGARCAVHDGALIGSQGECDVVLCDDGIVEQAARVRVGAGTWRLDAHEDAAEPTLDAPFGAPLALGPVLLTVAPSTSPWPEAGALALMASGVNEEKGAGRQVDGEALDSFAPAVAVAPGPGSAIPSKRASDGAADEAWNSRAARRRKGAGLRWAVGGLLVVLVCGSVASFPPTTSPARPRMETGTTADTEPLLRVRRLLGDQGYGASVRADLGADQEIVVTGWVRDEKEHDRLATALSAVWPLPAMRVGTETALDARVKARLDDLDVRVATARVGAGAVAVTGLAGTEAAREAAYSRWREDADANPPVGLALMLPEDATEALNQAVAASSLPAVTASWKDKALYVDASSLDPSQREKLQGIVETLNPGYAYALRIAGAALSAQDGMPFRVQTVVGGRQPWVVLDDGTRIAVGGAHGAYRLTSIDDGRVTFDGPTTAIISR